MLHIYYVFFESMYNAQYASFPDLLHLLKYAFYNYKNTEQNTVSHDAMCLT